jgi:hypothetical protein
MEKNFVLPERKIVVKPIVRDGGWLPDGHDGKFMYTGTSKGYCVPINSATNVMLNPLAEDEQRFFEEAFKMEKDAMSPYRKKDNYWANREITLDRNERVLDLSNHEDYIAWKILLSNKEFIAPSWDERRAKGTYEFALVDTTVETKKVSANIQMKLKANAMLGKITTHRQKMMDAIMVYRISVRDYAKLPESPDKDSLYILLDDIVSKDPQGFIKVMDDDDYEIKLMVQKLISYNMVTMNPSQKNRYVVEGTDLLGYPNELVELLKEPANQVIKAKLLLQIKEKDGKE